MSHHHSGEPHDIQALQRHLSDAHILTQPHAPVHDVLSHAGLLHEIEDTHHEGSHHGAHKHDHYTTHGVDVDVHHDSESPYYHHYTHGDASDDSGSNDDDHHHHLKEKHHHKKHHGHHHIDAHEAVARHHEKEVKMVH
jgi:hypothetical protein